MLDFVIGVLFGLALLCLAAIPFVAVFVALLLMRRAIRLFKLASDYRKRNVEASRVRVSVLAIALLTLFAADASACNRCRHYGSSCYYYKAQTYVAPVVQPSVSNVYVIQSNYPAPLVGQGSSSFSSASYTQSSVPYYDPTAFLSSALAVVRAGQDATSLAFSQANAHSQRIVELQAPAVERLAAGQAASQVLKAAGLDPAHNVSGQSTGFFISRSADGQMQVVPLQQSQIQQITAQSTTTITKQIPVAPQPQVETPQTGMLGQFCAKCHGLDVAAPKGGFYLGDDANVAKTMKDKFFEITQHVAVKKTMPPANSPQPTDEQRAAILDEIQALILKE